MVLVERKLEVGHDVPETEIFETFDRSLKKIFSQHFERILF